MQTQTWHLQCCTWSAGQRWIPALSSSLVDVAFAVAGGDCGVVPVCSGSAEVRGGDPRR